MRSRRVAGFSSVERRQAAFRNRGWSSIYMGGVSYKNDVASTSPSYDGERRGKGRGENVKDAGVSAGVLQVDEGSKRGACMNEARVRR